MVPLGPQFIYVRNNIIHVIELWMILATPHARALSHSFPELLSTQPFDRSLYHETANIFRPSPDLI